MAAPRPSAFRSFGRLAVLVPPVRVEAPECVVVGDGVVVHEHAWLCVQPQPGQPAPLLTLGDRTSINRFAKIVCHASVTIGADCIFSDRVYISDVEHVPAADGPPVLTAPRPVVLEDGVFLGIGAVIKPGVTIGAGSYIGASAVVTTDVPPHSLAAGAPAVVIRTRGAGGEWEPVTAPGGA